MRYEPLGQKRLVSSVSARFLPEVQGCLSLFAERGETTNEKTQKTLSDWANNIDALRDWIDLLRCTPGELWRR